MRSAACAGPRRARAIARRPHRGSGRVGRRELHPVAAPRRRRAHRRPRLREVRAGQRARGHPARRRSGADRSGQPAVPRGAGQRGRRQDRVRAPLRAHDVPGLWPHRSRHPHGAPGGGRCDRGEREHELRLHRLHRGRAVQRAGAGVVAGERPHGVPARHAGPGAAVHPATGRAQRAQGEHRVGAVRAVARGGVPEPVPRGPPVSRGGHRVARGHPGRPAGGRARLLQALLRAQQRHPDDRRQHRRPSDQGPDREVLRHHPPRTRPARASGHDATADRGTATDDQRPRRAAGRHHGVGDPTRVRPWRRRGRRSGRRARGRQDRPALRGAGAPDRDRPGRLGHPAVAPPRLGVLDLGDGEAWAHCRRTGGGHPARARRARHRRPDRGGAGRGHHQDPGGDDLRPGAPGRGREPPQPLRRLPRRPGIPRPRPPALRRRSTPRTSDASPPTRCRATGGWSSAPSPARRCCPRTRRRRRRLPGPRRNGRRRRNRGATPSPASGRRRRWPCPAPNVSS